MSHFSPISVCWVGESWKSILLTLRINFIYERRITAVDDRHINCFFD